MEAVTAAALAVVAASVGCTSLRVGVVVEGVVGDMAAMEVMGVMGVMEAMGGMGGMEGMGVMDMVHMEGMGVMDMQDMGLMGHLGATGDLEDTGAFLLTQLSCGTKMAGHYPPYIFHQDKGIEVGVVVKEGEGAPPLFH